MKGDVLALPFDQYQRYRLAADILRRLRGAGPRLALLDVGGRTAVLREFLSDAKITLVDIEPSDESGLVLGDGARLPFKDASFDAVCAFDTLEHVPPRLREPFVAECRRVARRWVLLVGPYDAPRVVEAEQLLQRFLRDKLGEAHRYLGEHLANGLPDLARTQSQLRALGARVLSIGHGNLDRWLVLQCMSMYMDYDPALRGLRDDFQRFYNASLYASDHAEPVYRHVVVAALGDAPLPEVAGLLATPAAPAEALGHGFDLAAELVHFDRARAEWSGERARLREVIATLERDLAGHRAGLADSQRERARLEQSRIEYARVVSDLKQDLAGHRGALEHVHEQLAAHTSSLAQARAELDELHTRSGYTEREYRAVLADRDAHRAAGVDLRAALAAERAQAVAVRTDLERDLAGHRERVATLQADLDGHRAVVATLRKRVAGAEAAAESVGRDNGQLRAHAATLEQELGGTRAHAAVLAADLDGHRKSLAKLGADLDGHRKSLATLAADLDGHRKVVAEQRARIEVLGREYATLAHDHGALQREHSALAAELAGERAQRTELETALARSDAELRRTLDFASGIEHSLAQRELIYDQLRAELRSRWRNLVRVFRPSR